MIGVDRALIRPFNRFAVGCEVEVRHLIGELLPFWMKEDAYPANMVLRRIGMRYRLTQTDFNFE